MTIKTRIECDGRGCSNELQLDETDTPSVAMHYAGWHEDPNDAHYHYCKTCWPKVKAEIEGRDR